MLALVYKSAGVERVNVVRPVVKARLVGRCVFARNAEVGQTGNLLLACEGAGEAVFGGVVLEEVIARLEIGLAGKAIAELHKRRGRQGPDIAQSKQVRSQVLLPGSRSCRTVELVVIRVIVLALGAAHKDALIVAEVVVDPEIVLIVGSRRVLSIGKVVGCPRQVWRREESEHSLGHGVPTGLWNAIACCIGSAVAGRGCDRRSRGPSGIRRVRVVDS